MQVNVQNYNEIARGLKIDYPKMSDFEIVSLAIQIERNQLLENGLAVNRDDSKPGSLEAIAICLGYTDRVFKHTITDVLKEIAEK